jgi:hypothetical protein
MVSEGREIKTLGSLKRSTHGVERLDLKNMPQDAFLFWVFNIMHQSNSKLECKQMLQ